MQPPVEKKSNENEKHPLPLLDHLQSLVAKNETAYANAMRDFREQFNLGMTSYDLSED